MLRASIILIGLALPWMALAQSSEDVPSPMLKRSVTVVRDVVRIGDLVDNAGAAAEIPIFRSPDPGTTGSVSAAAVIAALKSQNLVLGELSITGDIEVTRAARIINAKDIELRVTRAFAGQYGLPEADRLAAVFDNGPRTLYLDPSVAGELQVLRSQYEPRSKRFDITLLASANSAGRPVQLRYTGSLFEPAEVAVIARPLARGDVIRAADVAIERKPKTELATDAIGSLDEVIGFASRQPLRPGQIVRRVDLAKPEVIKRDEIVTLVYQVPGIVLTVRGKALEAGAEGEVITVQNVQSKRNVQGTVSGPGLVTVASTSPAVFEASASAGAERPPARTE